MSADKDRFITGLAQQQRTALERFLARKLDNPEDAAEVAQDAFLRLQRLDAPQDLDNPKAFLFQVASNLAVDQLRRRTLHFRFVRSETRQDEDEQRDINASGVSPEQVLEAQEKLKAIFDAINELPQNTRQAFLLHRQRGLSYADIATEMGVSVSSVEKYILQALRHCRKKLDQYYPVE